MAEVVKCQLADTLAALGDATPFEPQTLQAREGDDLFLCALGFEPRCLTLPRMLKDSGYRAKRAAYFEYATNLDDNAANRPELVGCLRQMAGLVDVLEADASEFPSRLRELLERVVGECGDRRPRITIDISVTANRLLLRCVKVLLECSADVRILYTEAAVYHPTKREYERAADEWEREDVLSLERGVADVVPSVDHPGDALEPLPDCVLLFPSFKAERSKAVISFVDPSLLANPCGKVIWLVGIPHLEEDRWRLDAMTKINGVGDDSRRYDVGTFDYKESLRILERLHGELAEQYRLTLSPLGSKMQALGIALFCYMHPDVRVVFSTPIEYNAAQYSKGYKAAWKIELGPMEEVRRLLDRVGTLRIED